MVKYKDKIIAYFDGCPDGVVAANELYEKEFSKMSEPFLRRWRDWQNQE